MDAVEVGSAPLGSINPRDYRFVMALIKDNELTGAFIVGGFGDAAEIRDNRVEWAAWGIESGGTLRP